jgi:hypothetical protein
MLAIFGLWVTAAEAVRRPLPQFPANAADLDSLAKAAPAAKLDAAIGVVRGDL